MSKQCDLYPLINGEPSELYKDLQKLTKNRPLTNYIYAAYLQSGVAAKMDAKELKRNAQGEHSAKDVYSFFEVVKMVNESANIFAAEKSSGAKDAMGNRINYTDAKQALNIAQQFNETHTGLVASVIPHGEYFNILIEVKDSRTHSRVTQVKEQLSSWQIIEQVFNGVGIDINAVGNNPLTRPLVNPTQGMQMIQYLGSLQRISNNKLLSKRDIALLLLTNTNNFKVQRLITKFGSLDDTIQAIYDNYRIPSSTTSGEKTLIDSTLADCKSYNGIDLNALKNQLVQDNLAVKNNDDEDDIHIILKTLNQKYGIEVNEVAVMSNEIKSLEQAAANAAFTIQRQLNKLESQEGVTEKGKQLNITLKQLLAELRNKRYYAGCLNFLREANNQIMEIENLLNNLPTTGTNMEIAAETAKVLMEIKTIKDAYYPVVEALSAIEAISADENISDMDKQTLKNTATAIKNNFDKHQKVVDELRKSTMLSITTEILGDSLPTGVAISNLLEMAEEDSSYMDYLYSISRSSNPLIGAMGKVIRDAQNSRDEKLNAIALRVRRAENNLRKAGHTNSFMYGPDGYIISDIDWDAYKKAANKERAKLKKSGLKGLALKEAMESWEEANTEDRIVDFTNGRTEKVPNSNYRKPFPDLTEAQENYYKEMMQIKGEMGSLLPKYAQKQYLPPQIRRSFLDAIAGSRSVKDVVTAIKNKLQDLWKIREDDTDYIKNGVINGEEYGLIQGSLDNTPLKQMPIFHVNELKDQKELLKDFSGAIQQFAGVAINYDTMYQVKDTIEFMGDFIKGLTAGSINQGHKEAEVIVDTGIQVFKRLTKLGKNLNTADIIDGFIDQHIYGNTLKDQGKWSKLIKSIIAYTSLKGLAVNVPGMISNAVVGELQLLIEAGAGEFYSMKDLMWAHANLFGGGVRRAPGKIVDFFTNNENSYDVLLANTFEPVPGNFDKRSHKRYYHSIFRQLISSDFAFLGYSAGEHMIHYLTMYAVLNHEKVLIDGKKVSLYEAFTIENKDSGNSELVLKSGVTDLNGNPLNEEYLDEVRKKIRQANQTTHGSMNKEDKGLIHRRLLGRAIMNFRQWMVEVYSKRYRENYYDATVDKWREGYYRTVGKLLIGFLQDYKMFQTKAALHWKDMDETQQANVRRFRNEMIVLGSLFTLSFALGEPEDHKKDFWYRMWIYQTKRALLDIEAMNPIGAFLNAKTMLNSPIASVNTINGFLYPIFGLPDINDTIKSGPYKGWNKYGRNFLKYTVPFYNQIDKILKLGEDESIFSIFDNSNKYR